MVLLGQPCEMCAPRYQVGFKYVVPPRPRRVRTVRNSSVPKRHFALHPLPTLSHSPAHQSAPGAGAGQAAWEKLHTGAWQDAAPAWRDAYALACLACATAALRARAPRPADPAGPLRAPRPDEAELPDAAAPAPAAGEAGPPPQPSTAAPPGGVLHATENLAAALAAAAQPQGVPGTAPPQPGAAQLGAAPTGMHTGGPPAAAPAEQQQDEAGRLVSALRECDLALLMGGPRLRSAVLRAVAALQARWRALGAPGAGPPAGAGGGAGGAGDPARAAKRPRIDSGKRAAASRQDGLGASCKGPEGGALADDCSAGGAAGGRAGAGKAGSGQGVGWGDQDAGDQELDQRSLPGGALAAGRALAEEELPSLERFVGAYMCAAGGGAPVVITGARCGQCDARILLRL